MDFYNSIADDYDEMTNLDQRMKGIDAFVDRLMGKYDIDSALDAACGTGQYVISLANKGVKAVGADISEGMIDKARVHAAAAGVQVDWLHCPMQRLSKAIDGEFDLILCLGNSIPHILSLPELTSTLKGFASLLRPGGVLLIHLLNYEKIVAEKKRIVAVSRNGDKEYIRFYDFLPELIQFNLLKVTWHEDKSSHEMVSTQLYPYSPNAMYQSLRQHFTQVDMYCDLQFNPFTKDSNAVVFEAR